MTSQQPFTLNPSYSGPMIIAETLRKMKSNNGLNRMLSSYNKRFFVLDLNYCTFYYLPDKQAHFTSSTDIPLSSIISIKVTKQSQGLEEDRIWKHEFVITTKKKSFELIADCKNLMEKMLYAFGNLINTKTNKPLFNWNQYVGAQDTMSSPSKLPLPKSVDTSPQKQSEASFMTPEESPVDVKAYQPEQRGEALSAELTKIERASQEEEAQQSPGKESCSSDDQKENKQSQEGAQKKHAPLQFRRKGNSFAMSRGKGFAVEEEQEKAGQQEATSPVKQEEIESVQEQEEPKQSPSPVKEKLQIKIQMLNFEKIEEDEIKGQEQQRLVCSSRDMSKKYNPGEQAVRRSANRLVMNHKSASMKNMNGPEGDFVGFNQIDLTSKNRSSKGNEGQGSARVLNVQKQASFGTGIGQEANKFSLFKKSEKQVEVKRDDEDWDSEMFGNGKNQLSPLKPKNHEDKQRQAYEYKNMSSEKKIQSQLSQKRSEFVASRQGTHNDWDDEL